MTKTTLKTVDLGTPIKTVKVLNAVYGVEDGLPVIYTSVTGDPTGNGAIFYVIDLSDMKVLRSFPMKGSLDAWTHALAPDGTVYIGALHQLFQYSPKTKQFRCVSPRVLGEHSIWALTTDEQGNVFGGTYPSGKVFKYDPVEDSFTDYGTVAEGQKYVRSITVYNGYVYAGTGTQGRIVMLHPESGEVTAIPMPAVPDLSEIEFVYGITRLEHYLFLYFRSHRNELFIYDLDQETWVDGRYDQFFCCHIPPAMNGNAYFTLADEVVEFNLETLTPRPTGIKHPNISHGGWIELEGDQDFPGKTLVTMQYNGTIKLINPVTKQVRSIPPVMEGEPNMINTMEKGPDGRLYMAASMGTKGGEYDLASGTLRSFPIGQADAIGFFRDTVIFGVYPHCNIYRWNRNEADSVPKKWFDVEGQSRIMTIAAGDNELYIGTVPEYGKHGGALIVCNPEVEDPSSIRVYRNVVENHSFSSLTYRDGKLYGSTSVYGGLGCDPVEKDAKVFIFDPAEGRVIHEQVPSIPGLRTQMSVIGALSFGPDGLLWAVSAGAVFAMEPNTLEIVKSKVIYPDAEILNHWDPMPIRWTKDGMMYATPGRILTSIDPLTLEHESLGVETLNVALDDEERVHYTYATHLYRIGG